MSQSVTLNSPGKSEACKGYEEFVYKNDNTDSTGSVADLSTRLAPVCQFVHLYRVLTEGGVVTKRKQAGINLGNKSRESLGKLGEQQVSIDSMEGRSNAYFQFSGSQRKVNKRVRIFPQPSPHSSQAILPASRYTTGLQIKWLLTTVTTLAVVGDPNKHTVSVHKTDTVRNICDVTGNCGDLHCSLVASDWRDELHVSFLFEEENRKLHRLLSSRETTVNFIDGSSQINTL
ncbi:hypothetical protein J6590_051881 [Homalodisca vitripennis]|nr:hypothetical protein J6590_051881 [Homalodisca vitripennis]